MTNIVRGNIWYSDAELICITTNGTVIGDNLVMGAGVALQAKDKYAGLENYAGITMNSDYNRCHRLMEVATDRGIKSYYLYGFIPVFCPSVGKLLGFFQTKIDWSKNASLALIGYSIYNLNWYIQQTRVKSVALNFPGIGFGGLKRLDVLPLLASLDERVTVYEI